MTSMMLASGAEAELDNGVLTFGTDADRQKWRADALAQGWTEDASGCMVPPFADLPPVALTLTVR